MFEKDIHFPNHHCWYLCLISGVYLMLCNLEKILPTHGCFETSLLQNWMNLAEDSLQSIFSTVMMTKSVLTHTIHVWYICLHEWLFSMVNYGKCR